MNVSKLTGYITVQDAADIIGCSKSRIYQYVKLGRLPAQKIGPLLLLPESNVRAFRPGPAGRQRGVAPPWRRYRNKAELLATVIHVPIQPGMQKKLQAKLDALFENQDHLFTSNVERYIMEEHGDLEIVLIWKTTEMPDETTRQRDLRSFQQESQEVLDWERATYAMKKLLLHT